MGLLIDPIKILQTNIIRIIWETVRRISNEILGVKGLKLNSANYRLGRFSRCR